jgi:cell wall-associated NlpC family hydrolase
MMQPKPTSSLRRLAFGQVLAWVALVFFALGGHGPVRAQATPAATVAATEDPLFLLLQERGVLPASDAALRHVQNLRRAATETVLAALAFLDLPYLNGGTSAQTGFDCSGFTRHVFKQALGLLLPRSAEQQAQDAKLVAVAAQDLLPGDLVFFNTLRKTFSHVGIYVGEGRFVHSPRQGAQVRIEDMQQAYWSKRFDGARRAAAHNSEPTSEHRSEHPAPSPAP